jgi:hypothetical protein
LNTFTSWSLIIKVISFDTCSIFLKWSHFYANNSFVASLWITFSTLITLLSITLITSRYTLTACQILMQKVSDITSYTLLFILTHLAMINTLNNINTIKIFISYLCRWAYFFTNSWKCVLIILYTCNASIILRISTSFTSNITILTFFYCLIIKLLFLAFILAELIICQIIIFITFYTFSLVYAILASCWTILARHGNCIPKEAIRTREYTFWIMQKMCSTFLTRLFPVIYTLNTIIWIITIDAELLRNLVCISRALWNASFATLPISIYSKITSKTVGCGETITTQAWWIAVTLANIVNSYKSPW